MRPVRALAIRALAILAAAAAVGSGGCGGGSSATNQNATLSLTLGASSVAVPQDGQAVTVGVSVSGASGTPTVALSGVPAGINASFTPNASGATGQLSFTGSATAAAGSYTATVTASVGAASTSQTLTVISAPVVSVGTSVDTTLGEAGNFAQFMATSFQIFQYTGDIFGSGATAIAREQTLNNLGALHDRLQVIAGGIPMVSNTGTAADWDFTVLDTTVQPVLTASPDHSPEFQIAAAPAWMCDSNGHLMVSAHAQDFATYAANLVRYYNKGGFDWGGKHFQSPAPFSITWWGIFNEPNINGISAADYVTLYNTVVPAMLAVDPTLKFSALEFSDFGMNSGGSGDPAQFLPTFLAAPGAGGVNAQVDVLSTHFYATCNQTDADTTLFGTVPTFVQNVHYFKQEQATRSDLANAQVWVTENNVNADYADANGNSTCNPGQKFVLDPRGTSAFFAAWRPYVFSQLGKAGNRALYQWEYAGDTQYGEVDANSTPYLSYWVDRTLATMFGTKAGSTAPRILQVKATDTSSIESLALANADGTMRVLLVDRAVHAAADNNGAGEPRTVILDLSQYGTFAAVSQVTLDANTDLVNGPTGAAVTPEQRLAVPLNGYGFTVLTLTP